MRRTVLAQPGRRLSIEWRRGSMGWVVEVGEWVGERGARPSDATTADDACDSQRNATAATAATAAAVSHAPRSSARQLVQCKAVGWRAVRMEGREERGCSAALPFPSSSAPQPSSRLARSTGDTRDGSVRFVGWLLWPFLTVRCQADHCSLGSVVGPLVHSTRPLPPTPSAAQRSTAEKKEGAAGVEEAGRKGKERKGREKKKGQPRGQPRAVSDRRTQTHAETEKTLPEQQQS